MEVRCRRAGGGFGGKMFHPDRFAGAAAVAAVLTGRQVRLAANRNADMAMIGGRCQVDVTYSVGFDEEGRLLALDLEHVLTVRGVRTQSQWECCVVRSHLSSRQQGQHEIEEAPEGKGTGTDRRTRRGRDPEMRRGRRAHAT